MSAKPCYKHVYFDCNNVIVKNNFFQVSKFRLRMFKLFKIYLKMTQWQWTFFSIMMKKKHHNFAIG